MAVEQITTLNIDGEAHAVDTLSDEIKSMVALYNEWNAKEYDHNNEMIMIRMAKETLSRQIIAKFKEKAENKVTENVGEPEPEVVPE